jgi:hypothetical protein
MTYEVWSIQAQGAVTEPHSGTLLMASNHRGVPRSSCGTRDQQAYTINEAQVNLLGSKMSLRGTLMLGVLLALFASPSACRSKLRMHTVTRHLRLAACSLAWSHGRSCCGCICS